MNIIKTSKELNVRERYAMTMSPAMQKMRNCVDQRLDVAAWCLYTDTDSDGKEQTILSILTPEGEVFATNSPTFQRDFENIVEIFADADEDFDAINIISGTSKAGREFITCTLA